MSHLGDNEEEIDRKAEIKKEQRRINNYFNDRLKEIHSGENKNYSPLILGKPSEILRSAGIPDLIIEMAVTRLIDKKLQKTHPFSIVSLVNLPDHLRSPIMVFRSKTRGDSKVIFTEMEDNGVNIIIALELNREKPRYSANDIRSVYPKDNILDVLRWISEDGLLDYCDKEKALKWMGKQQSISAEVTRLLEGSVKVIKDFINP